MLFKIFFYIIRRKNKYTVNIFEINFGKSILMRKLYKIDWDLFMKLQTIEIWDNCVK